MCPLLPYSPPSSKFSVPKADLKFCDRLRQRRPRAVHLKARMRYVWHPTDADQQCGGQAAMGTFESVTRVLTEWVGPRCRFGQTRADAEEYISWFEPSYWLQCHEITGDDVRLLRAYPLKWQVSSCLIRSSRLIRSSSVICVETHPGGGGADRWDDSSGDYQMMVTRCLWCRGFLPHYPLPSTPLAGVPCTGFLHA